jgi:hypothetical protein
MQHALVQRCTDECFSAWRAHTLGLWHAEVAADPACQIVVDLNVSWNSRTLPRVTVDEDGMLCPFSEAFTPVPLEMPDKVPAFHPMASGSLITS